MDGTFGVGFQGLSESRRLRKTAEELEAVVLAQLLSTMRNTVPEGGLFEKSAADDIFRSMFDQELARVMAEKSPFGLADEIVERFENRIKDDTPPTEPRSDDGREPAPDPSRSWRA